jgi:hypothetical protein
MGIKKMKGQRKQNDTKEGNINLERERDRDREIVKKNYERI